MRLTTMRDFQKKGAGAITAPKNEVVLLAGRTGPSYFLLPVFDTDLSDQAEQLQQAIAVSSLRESQNAAEQAGINTTSMDDIILGIDSIRAKRSLHKPATA